MTIIEALDLFSKIKGIEREKLYFSAEFEPVDEIYENYSPDTVKYLCASHYKDSNLGLKVTFFKDKLDCEHYYHPVFEFIVPNIRPQTNEIFKLMKVNFRQYGTDPNQHPYLFINKFNSDENRINAFIERVEFDPKEITTNYTSTKVENVIVK